MKHKILSSFALAALVFALTFTIAAPAAPPAGSTHPATSAAPAPAPEPHPEIREAIAALRRAKEHMEHAAHDFGGHRVEALKATDEAIHQLEICLKFDK
jgi:hypothetical protein